MKIKKNFKNFTKKIGNIAFAVLTAVGTTIVSPVTEVHAESLSDGDHSGLVSAGIKYLGASYSTADRLGPSSFDCSGFVDRLASDAGLDSTPLNEGWTTDSWVTYFANAGVSYEEVASQEAAANIDVNAGDIKRLLWYIPNEK